MLRANRSHNRFNHLAIKMFVALASVLMAIFVADRTIAPPDGTVSALVRLITGAPPPPPMVPLVTDWRWFAGQEIPDEIRGHRLSQHGWNRQFFDTNPRGYFATSSSCASRLLTDWKFDDVQGRTVQIQRPEDQDWLSVALGAEGLKPVDTAGAILKTREGSRLLAGRSAAVTLRIRSDHPRTLTIQFIYGEDDQRIEESTFTIGPETTSLIQQGAVAAADVIVRSRIILGAGAGTVEFSDLAIDPAPSPTPGHDKKFFVDYRLNRLGFRDVDRPLACPAEVLRIICLGDSNTFGQGVHFEDTYPCVLERLCNQDRQPDVRVVQALNFGISGYATDAQYDVYANDAEAFGGQIVFVQLCWNDGVSTAEDTRLFRQTAMKDARKYLETLRDVIRENGFSRTIEYLHRLHERCIANHAALVVGIFNDRDTWEWDQMVREVLPAMNAAGIPAFEFGPVAERSGLGVEQRVVHPSDQHPNEKMHALFAQDIKRVLEELRLLP